MPPWFEGLCEVPEIEVLQRTCHLSELEGPRSLLPIPELLGAADVDREAQRLLKVRVGTSTPCKCAMPPKQFDRFAQDGKTEQPKNEEPEKQSSMKQAPKRKELTKEDDKQHGGHDDAS